MRVRVYAEKYLCFYDAGRREFIQVQDIYAKLEENDKTRQKWLESRLESSTPRTKKCYKIEIFCVFRDVFRFNWCFRGVCDGFSRLLFSYARDQVSVLLPRSVLCHMPATRGYFEVNNNELSNSKFSCK